MAGNSPEPVLCKARHSVFFAALVPALLLPSLTAVFYSILLSSPASVRTVFAFDKAFLIAWPVIALTFILKARPKFRISDIRTYLRAVPLGIGVGILILAFRYAVMETSFGGVVDASSPRIQAKMEQLGFLSHFWLFGLLISFVHSFIEEYYWRWFLFGQLRRTMPIPLAHVIAGLFFSGYHIIMASQLLPGMWFLFAALTGAGGVIWSVMYQYQKTLAGIWVSHIIVDLGIMATAHKAIFGTWF